MTHERMKANFIMLINYIYLHSHTDEDFVDTLVYLGFTESEIKEANDMLMG